jgi:hypothetical protein
MPGEDYCEFDEDLEIIHLMCPYCRDSISPWIFPTHREMYAHCRIHHPEKKSNIEGLEQPQDGIQVSYEQRVESECGGSYNVMRYKELDERGIDNWVEFEAMTTKAFTDFPNRKSNMLRPRP